MNNSNSGSRNSRPGGQNRRPRKSNSGNRPQGGQKGQGGASKNRSKKNFRSSSNRRRRYSGKKLTPLEKAQKAYLLLLERHLEARKKYFDLFHRADPRQLAKLERIFSESAKALLDYEDSVGPEIKEEFMAKKSGLPLDTAYSDRRELEEIVLPRPEEIFDPHFLVEQKEADFQNDQEESEGTLEDYKRYKGVY